MTDRERRDDVPFTNFMRGAVIDPYTALRYSTGDGGRSVASRVPLVPRRRLHLLDRHRVEDEPGLPLGHALRPSDHDTGLSSG